MLRTAQAMQTALAVVLQTAIVMVVTVRAVQTQLQFTMAHLTEMSAMMMAGILWETPQATEMMRQLSLITTIAPILTMTTTYSTCSSKPFNSHNDISINSGTKVKMLHLSADAPAHQRPTQSRSTITRAWALRQEARLSHSDCKS